MGFIFLYNTFGEMRGTTISAINRINFRKGCGGTSPGALDVPRPRPTVALTSPNMSVHSAPNLRCAAWFV